MSAHNHIELPPDGERLDASKVSSIRNLAFAIGGIGLVVSAIIFLFTPLRDKYIYSWLFGFYYFFSLSLGGLFWMLLHNATNSGWGVAVRRVWENMACVVPFMFLLVIPILVPGLRDSLYEWTAEQTVIQEEMTSDREVSAAAGSAMSEGHGGLRHAIHEKVKTDPHKHLLYHKYPYLNKTFFYFRAIGYFVILGFIALFMRRMSALQDADGDVKWTLRSRRAACGFLPVFAVGVSFAAIDFLKALDYHWFSTMWGVYIFAGCALNSMAVAILLTIFLKKLGYLKLVNDEHFHVMGKLMFAFVLFWAYVTFSQYFLIWYANIPEETKYFLIRNTEGWHIGSSALMWVHFVIPFLFLLPAWIKKSTKYVALACVWNLIAHALDYYLIIIPERYISLASDAQMLQDTSPSFPFAFLLDILAFVTVGGLVVWFFLGMLTKRSLYPCRDPRLHETLNLIN